MQVTNLLARLQLVQEEILEPERPIIDAHHHLWKSRLNFLSADYLLEDLWADTGSGHNIQKTVFIECGTAYRKWGDKAFQPQGETEFAKALADLSAKGPAGAARIAAIVGHADLLLGARVGDVLDAHLETAPALFKGIRHVGSWDPNRAETRTKYCRSPETLYQEPAFREGFRELAKRGLSFDAFNFHHALPRLTDLARANPDVTIILDHLGGPVGFGPYKNKRAEIFAQWKLDMADLAACENVVVKLGGMSMRISGFGWHERPRPATSDELVAAQRDYFLHAIDRFGPARCLFESNFPVDKVSASYAVIWNAYKKIAASFNASEKNALFYDTAARIYRT